jgi:diazepam-binding inhibitor (GABA receptor modulating acyl-CoA-binding protein)
MAVAEFKQAVAYVQNLPGGKISQKTQLQFYALFKQSTEGSVRGKQPGRLKIVARAKYGAWKKLGNMSKDAAMDKYCGALTELVGSKWKTTQRAKL